MTRRQRILLVVLVIVLALLFVATLVNQRRAGEGEAGSTPAGVIGVLGDWLGDAAAADPQDLSANCRVPDGRLVFDGSCTIDVAAAPARMRLVRVSTSQEVSITAPAPVGDFTIRADLAPGESTQVAVGAAGSRISLRCRADADCVVRLGGQDG